MKHNILITGGNGYIGQNMYCKKWATENADIDFKICDKHTTIPSAECIEKKHLVEFNGIIHFAALSGIIACEENHGQAIVDNIMAAGNIFKLSVECNIPVVFTSSQAAKNPFSSVYAYTKWACEMLADYYNKKGGKIYIVRLANVYSGDNYLEKKRTCIRQFVTQYKNGDNFEIHGDGKQIRDFVHVYDVCEAIYRIITKQPDYFNPIDIGTGKGHSVMDVVDMFPSHMFKFINGRNAGAESSIANTSILEQLTGFKPKRKLEDSIKEYLKEIIK